MSVMGRTARAPGRSPSRSRSTALLEGNPIFVSAVVPRQLVVELGGFSTETWGSEDHDLWLRILEQGYEVAVNPQPLVIYREAQGSVSASFVGHGPDVAGDVPARARTRQALAAPARGSRGGISGCSAESRRSSRSPRHELPVSGCAPATRRPSPALAVALAEYALAHPAPVGHLGPPAQERRAGAVAC